MATYEVRKMKLERRATIQEHSKWINLEPTFASEDVKVRYMRLLQMLKERSCNPEHRETITVDHSHSGKEITRECRQFYCGDLILCDECQKKFEEKYPQGWYHVPGDVCKHGKYVGGMGADLMCGYCENGE